MNWFTYLLYRIVYRKVSIEDHSKMYSQASFGLHSGQEDVAGMAEQYCLYFERRWKIKEIDIDYRSWQIDHLPRQYGQPGPHYPY